MARVGKIARLPLAVREELNRRLLENEKGSKILPWLNALPEVVAVLEEDFEGLRVSDQNLSEWRKGGFEDWSQRRERVAHTKELAHFASKLTAANGGSIAEGAAAIASGKLLELLEATDGTLDPEQIADIISGLTGLRAQEVAQQRVDLDAEKLKRKDQEIQLEREKFRRTTCELFLKWREDERARNIADGPGTSDEKIEQLGQAMFGDLWKS